MPLTAKERSEMMRLEIELGLRKDPLAGDKKSNSMFSRSLNALENVENKLRATPLGIPERKSREGLTMIAKSLTPNAAPQYTGNLPRDVAMNTGRVISETASEVAPGFVAPTALLMAGASGAVKVAKPLIKGAGRMVASGLESLSGLEHKTPGVLTEAFNNPKLMFSSGSKSAGEMFDKLVKSGKIRKELADMSNPIDLINKAIKLNANLTPQEALFARKLGVGLTPQEALYARQVLDSQKRKLAPEFFRRTRKLFDSIAKTETAKADAAFRQGLKADALRTPFPINKTGGSSSFKLGIGAAGGGGLIATQHPILAALTAASMSPAIQGAGATTAGAAAKLLKPVLNNPGAVVGAIGSVKAATRILQDGGKVLTDDKAMEFLRKAKGNKDKAREMALKKGYIIPEE